MTNQALIKEYRERIAFLRRAHRKHSDSDRAIAARAMIAYLERRIALLLTDKIQIGPLNRKLLLAYLPAREFDSEAIQLQAVLIAGNPIDLVPANRFLLILTAELLLANPCQLDANCQRRLTEFVNSLYSGVDVSVS